MNQQLNKISNSIKPIDFRHIIHGKNDQTLKENHYLIIAVEQLLKISEELGYGFCNKNGFIYFFNGEYWEQMPEDYIKALLSITSSKLGIDKYKAKYYHFADSLFRQFIHSTPVLRESEGNDILINLKNGTFGFGVEFGIREFRKNDYLTYQLPFKYDAKATCPQFFDYLNKVLPDVDCQQILSEFLGYVFTKGHKHQKCLLLYGSGSNGKSVFFEITRALLGKENITSYSLRNLGDENCRALISNKLLNYSSEIDASINKDTFKQLCSGEPLQARLKYRDSFMIENYAKLMFNCNELPKDVEFSNAYFRRFLIIPFTQIIPEGEQDKDLAGKIIKSELSGIFNWILTGLERLANVGSFTESEVVNQALKEFREEADSVHQFIHEYGYQYSENHIGLTHLYKEYDMFCKDNGYRTLNVKNFRKRLELQNIPIKRLSKGNCVYVEEKRVNAFMDDQDDTF